MTKGILSALALVALGGTAFAADLPSRKGAVYAPIAPVFTWTGFYVGVNAGAVFTTNDTSLSGTAANTIANVAALRRPQSFSSDKTGFIGGGQIGYNYQIGQIVLGAEADFQYTDTKKTTSFLGTSGATSTFRNEMDYLGTVRARVGYAFDRFMVYGTGGLAYANVETAGAVDHEPVYGTGGLAYANVENRATFFSAAVPGQIDYIGNRSDTQVGYAVGGGLEYAFTNNLSAKVEYLYYDLGKKNNPVNLTAAGPVGGSYVARNDTNGHIVRAGLNYRFSTY